MGIAVLWVGDYSLFMEFKPVVSMWGVSASVADLTITVAMTYHLHRAKGGFEATDRLLDHIIQRESWPAIFLYLQSSFTFLSYLAQWLSDIANHTCNPLALYVCGTYIVISSSLLLIHFAP